MVVKRRDFRKLLKIWDHEKPINPLNYRLAFQLIQRAADMNWRDPKRFRDVVVAKRDL